MVHETQYIGLDAAAAGAGLGECECCNSPAVVLVVDKVRRRPVEDNEGFWHQSLRPAGTHRFCAAHQRPPETAETPEYRQWVVGHPAAVEA